MAVEISRMIHRGATAALLGVAMLGLGACASGSGGSTRGGGPDAITYEQIVENTNSTNAYELVQRVRPRWLRPRNSGTFSSGGPIEPVVFVDEIRFGGLASLGQLSTANIERLRYMSAPDATTLYGTGYMGGIIHVYTR